ncbi:uncharacterized protein PHACADRAFT_147283 [Phanerochaete carnosa HHB-10118-sp]|uniref:FAD-binding PCMH-type domain-containing protein n=1 Tax=Phanerochaete carnosa (strain HHB-10118-sp) TaxID=650164 RepID=K5W1I5_PHACS|nr:uncharacterized protein PHACADRAFT_147283 [Phanerochaete carnosa HHB-10118-sp]EKM52970.1 hypothetical protein PHACADRAFT_147283 [Phanerochaete carnosa HHB-10118-sp]
MSDSARFRDTFKGDILTPEDEGYERALARWAVNAIRRARIVAYVRDAEDVSTALRYAKENGIKVAIHGGGHSPNGASSVQDGLVIDLARYLNGVRADPENRLAYVGGGAKWATVNKATMEHGLAMVGGTVGHVSCSLLTLGGGYGWLSPMHGLTIDHLVSATVVPADGIVRTASKTENPDLFWGIRGGGCNFGVVTEFVFALHSQQRMVFGGPVIFSPDKLETIAKLIEAWFPTAGPKEAVHAYMGRGQDGSPAVTLLMFYNGSESEGRETFKSFTDLGPIVDTRREMSYDGFNSLLDEWAAPGKCNWIRGVAVDRATKVLMPEIFNKVVELSPPGKPFRVSLNLEYMSQDKVNSVPNDETAYSRDRPGLGNGIGAVFWDEDKPGLEAEAKQILDEITGLVKIPGLRYGNFNADTDVLPAPGATAKRTRAQELYGENYPRLQQLKRKYDPEMIFDKWYVIQPAPVDGGEL